MQTTYRCPPRTCQYKRVSSPVRGITKQCEHCGHIGGPGAQMTISQSLGIKNVTAGQDRIIMRYLTKIHAVPAWNREETSEEERIAQVEYHRKEIVSFYLRYKRLLDRHDLQPTRFFQDEDHETKV